MRRFLPALLLFAAWTLPAQDEGESPYFALSTDRPVRPGETASLRVQAWSVDKLQFRLYRVSEPVTFFEKLENAHQFGGQMRRAPRDLTWLEKFHAWKHRTRATIRDVARAQFSAENRASLRKSMIESERKAVSTGPASTDYAAIPILNQQQLVRVWEQPVKGAQRWESVNVPLSLPDKGVYLVEATDGKRMAYTIVSVTNLAVVTKAVPGKFLVRVVDRESGAGIEDCAVIVWDKASNAALVRERTGAGGVLEAPFNSSADAESVLVLARTNDDFAASTLWAGSLSTNPERSITGVIYTDRPVYRPGHTVHFKAILRTLTGAEYLLPKTPNVPVTVEDPDGQPVYRTSLPLSSMGTLKGDFVLSAGAALGYYSVRTGEEGRGVYGGFQVEEYRKPEYEVRVRPAVKRVNQGSPASVEIEARYYYGEPVASAKVAYAVHRMRYWRPWELDQDTGDDTGDQFYGSEQILEEAGTLDAKGKLTVDIPTQRGDFDATYRVEARVTDASQREIAGAGSFLATQGPFFIDVRPDKYVYSPGDRIQLALLAQDYDGKPVSGIEIRVEVLPYRSDQKTGAAVQTVTTRTDADGKAKMEFPAPDPGSYTIRATATSDGATITDTAWLWVTGNAISWGGREERIQIVPDKTSYRPGDTARLLIVTGQPGTDLWVACEGRTLFSNRLVKAPGTSTTVEVPITAAHEPNFYLDVSFVKNNKLYRGSKSLRVPPLEKTLQVEVKTPKAEYKPGEPATFRVQARDYQGKPAAAELSLGIVDEAIYGIRKEPHADITQVFYGRTYNRVQTESSFYYSFFGEAGTRRVQLARLRPPLARGQLKPERLVTPKVRKAFPDTLYWIADLRTGSDGGAEVKVEFPDALTTWRATARAVTADTRVGGAVNKNVVRKNLILTLATPRFLTEGDQVTIPAIVRNYLPSEKKVHVTLEAKGAEIMEGAPRDITVESRGEGRVDFKLRVLRGSQVTLLGQALTNEESDALELPLPVYPVGVRQTAARSGSLRGDAGPARFSLEPPKGGAPHTRTLDIVLAPSLAGSIFAALEYLTSYPYGCVEQTMSSFLPNVIVTQAMKELKLKTPVDEAELARKTRAGIERLYGMQHEDGGWGWWTWDETHPFMTAYVTGGLAQARDAGYKVRDDVLERARRALAAQMNSPTRVNADLLAYQVYALALAGGDVSKSFDAAFNQRSTMTGYGLGLLGIAARKINDRRAVDLATLLESRAREQGDEAWWPADRDALLDFPMDASPEATAFAVRFLAAERPQSSLLEKSALWLVNHRDEGYYWGSTKQTAMVIFGLTEYLKHSDEMKPEFTANVMVNGKVVATKRFDAIDAPPFRVQLATSQLSEANAVEVAKTGGGRLYWSTQMSAVVNAADGLRTGNSSLHLTRDYFRLAPVDESGRVVYRMIPLEGNVNPGDLLAVRLTLSGEGRYLMLEDPIPAGAEPVSRDEGYELKEKPPWWQSWADRRELRDNRAVYFERILGERETKQYTYLLKVTNAGQFAISPARVLPMYQPQVMTATPSRGIEVQPR